MKLNVFLPSLLSAVLLLSGCNRVSPDLVGGMTTYAAKVEKCDAGDRPETGFQGQVPAALRAQGFNGFNCNLKLVGQYAGEGGGMMASYQDKAGHICAYYSTMTEVRIGDGSLVPRKYPGVQVIDITDPARPVRVGSLTSTAMMDTWESLKVNPRRGLLVGNNGTNSVFGGPAIDIYDLSADCRKPVLQFSGPVGAGTDGGIKFAKQQVGHEGNFPPDGKTYYIGDVRHGTYNAIDISDPRHPKALAQYQSPYFGKKPFPDGTAHGLSLSADGKRGYFVIGGAPTPADLSNPQYKNVDGFLVMDTSEIQALKPNARMKLISATAVPGGSMAQHTVPARIGGREYLIYVPEGGGVAAVDATNPSAYGNGVQAACAAGYSPFPRPSIYDISDERHPKEVSRLGLETNDPHNCQKIIPDLTGNTLFTYGSHYCSVDNRENATALACSYFNSGIRVFDIRNPAKPKEIAYYNPAGSRIARTGSLHYTGRQWWSGSPDWCASGLSFDFQRRMLRGFCMDNGVLLMKFAPGIWPMKESSPAVLHN